MAEKDKKKCHAVLLFKILHKFHLMRVNIGKRKRLDAAFLCIKADRDTLHHTDVIDSTFLFKIRKRDVSVLLVDL